MFAQHFFGLMYSKSFVNNFGDGGENISYTTRGKGFNIQYHYKYKRIGLEADLFSSSLNYDPYIEYEGGYSGHSSVNKAETKSINTYGLTTNMVCYLLPEVLYIKLGMVYMSSQYFEGSYLVEGHSYNSNVVTYNSQTVSSSRENSSGLSLGTGLLIPLYKQFYINGGIDYYFTTIKWPTLILTSNRVQFRETALSLTTPKSESRFKISPAKFNRTKPKFWNFLTILIASCV
jgi:hypothetical protein